MGTSSGKQSAETLAAKYEGMCQGYDKQTGASQVTAQELQAWLDDPGQDVVIFDTRGMNENSVSTLPGTRLLVPTMAGMAKALGGLGYLTFDAPIPRADTIPAETKVVCHCTAGLRSGFACSALQHEWKKQGVERTVFNLHGGIISWVNAGGQVVDPQSGEQRREVHTYGSKWEPYVDESSGVKAVKVP
mmetsp:Transcript_49027/g.88636  ORF Transcript_49027/g.88636 Transcript_49027/m.88636 type:complete len:189 (+) Transcript_49027:77-643(+)